MAKEIEYKRILLPSVLRELVRQYGKVRIVEGDHYIVDLPDGKQMLVDVVRDD